MTTATIPQQKITPDDLQKMPDEAAYELVDGQLVERHTGAESSEIGVNIAFLLKAFLRNKPIARIFAADVGYQCFAWDPDKLRRPDVSAVRMDRLPGGQAPKGYIRVAPDLAVEVISPNDTADEIDEKVDEYLRAGVRLIWVVSPVTRTVRIRRPRSASAGPISILTNDETISGEDVLPDFLCSVRDFFEVPADQASGSQPNLTGTSGTA
jgi:Uma2 family endonuclease